MPMGMHASYYSASACELSTSVPHCTLVHSTPQHDASELPLNPTAMESAQSPLQFPIVLPGAPYRFWEVQHHGT